MQKLGPSRRIHPFAWLACLGATGGCQLLFGVDLPGQDGSGTGAGGGTAGVPVDDLGGAPAMGGAGSGGAGSTGGAIGQGRGAGQSGTGTGGSAGGMLGQSGGGTGGSAGGMPEQGGAGGQGGVGGQTGEELIASKIAVGGHHFCALVSGGQVLCWGQNDKGQLGHGAPVGETQLNPTSVPVLQSPGGQPLTGVQALALGHQHSCALLSEGEVRCWGWNSQRLSEWSLC